MKASTLEAPRYCIPIARGSVNFTSIASLDLQTFIDPLPLDQLICYSADTVRSWPTEDREQILVVASRDLTVARRNLAELTRYVDIHAVHLATCTGGSDDTIPLMVSSGYRGGPARSAEGLNINISFLGPGRKGRILLMPAWSTFLICHSLTREKLKIVHSMSFNVMSTIISLPLKRVNPYCI